MKHLKQISLISLLVASVVLTGCASKKELAEVRALAEEALAKSNEANDVANQAAMAAADADAKIDNMFKKAMQK